MKVKELETMGPLEHRIAHGIYWLIMFGCPGQKNGFYEKFGSMKELSEEIANLEISDILDMYTEKEIMSVRNFGKKSMERLMELA